MRFVLRPRARLCYGPAVTAPSVRDVLGPHGWLARIDPTWEARPGQLAMAEQVATRLAKGGVSAIEAHICALPVAVNSTSTS